MGIGEYHPAGRNRFAGAGGASGFQGGGHVDVHLGVDRGRRRRARKSPGPLDRGEAWLFEHLPHVRRATPDVFYNVWAHAYSIQALTRMLGRKPGDADRQKQIRELDRQPDRYVGPL